MNKKLTILLFALVTLIVGCAPKTDFEKDMDCLVSAYVLLQHKGFGETIETLKKEKNLVVTPLMFEQYFTLSTLRIGTDSNEDVLGNSLIKEYNSSYCQNYHKQGKYPTIMTPLTYYIMYPFL